MTNPKSEISSHRDPQQILLEDSELGFEILEQVAFRTMLCLERRRTERSHRRFVLMLLESDNLLQPGNKRETLDNVLSALAKSTRVTDIKGWYEDSHILGVIFTEIGAAEGKSVAHALLRKVTNALCATLSIDQINSIRISFHVYPEPVDENGSSGPPNYALYPDLTPKIDPKRASRLVKRAMDIIGSLLALTFGLPVFLAIALSIKLTSKGPILFRQERVGRYGERFTFLKFRSMYVANDQTIHQEYVKRLIAGTVGDDHANGSAISAYKLKNDPRITPIGKLLRKTSMDELPQFWNVLNGQMSLVGPRPPVPYEFECYDIWHKRRVLSAKPGITGLWQVAGRSRVTFADMVRLDIEYAQSWTPWMDVKILLQTPRAVFSGEGAF